MDTSLFLLYNADMNPHQNPGVERRFIFSIVITFIILLAEVIGGLWTGSLALLSDSAHVFMDIFALALSFMALRLSSLPPDSRHTYGYHRLEVFAALVNGVSLALISIGIWWEAVQRFSEPTTIRSTEMLVIAVIGLLANLAVAFILGSHTHAGGEHDHSVEDLNVHSAFLHVVGDAVSSLGVILAAIIIGFTGWEWVDPLVSIFIGLLIAFSAYRVTRKSLHILIEGVPEGISLAQVEHTMREIVGVLDVHDLHVWNICSGHVALSAHVTMDDFESSHTSLRTQIKAALLTRFGIEHTTLQFESEPCDPETIDTSAQGKSESAIHQHAH
jgi:cobalt-zinc-cadmium efflux system protein